MSTLMVICLSMNIKSTFSLSLMQPFYSEALSCPVWLLDVRCRWSGSSVPLNQSPHLDVELLFALCFPQGSARGTMPNLEALQVCHDYIATLCVCVCVCLRVCICMCVGRSWRGMSGNNKGQFHPNYHPDYHYIKEPFMAFINATTKQR